FLLHGGPRRVLRSLAAAGTAAPSQEPRGERPSVFSRGRLMPRARPTPVTVMAVLNRIIGSVSLLCCLLAAARHATAKAAVGGGRKRPHFASRRRAWRPRPPAALIVQKGAVAEGGQGLLGEFALVVPGKGQLEPAQVRRPDPGAGAASPMRQPRRSSDASLDSCARAARTSRRGRAAAAAQRSSSSALLGRRRVPASWIASTRNSGRSSPRRPLRWSRPTKTASWFQGS